MHTFADLARELNRSPVFLRGLQTRFALPVLEGAAYPAAYLAFLRTVVFLRAFGISEDALLKLWHLETKLLSLLHVDSTGSPTWFLDACGQTAHRKRRLLLTNYDLGVAIPSRMLQLGLNFGNALPELFAGREMGEASAAAFWAAKVPEPRMKENLPSVIFVPSSFGLPFQSTL